METVAFYSYLGGMGRTLLMANAAQLLAKSGQRVVAIDFNLEAPELHYHLATPEVLRRAREGELPGAVDALLGTLEKNSPLPNLQDLTHTIDLSSESGGSLALIPAGSAPSHAYWANLERLNLTLRSERRSGGLLEAALEVQARIADELAPDYLLVDSRTGITELGGLATSLLADCVVCLTTPAPESIDGTLIVAEDLRDTPRLPSQKALRILFTLVSPDSPTSPDLERRLRQLGNFVAVLPPATTGTEQGQAPPSWLPTGSGGTAQWKDLLVATLSWIMGRVKT